MARLPKPLMRLVPRQNSLKIRREQELLRQQRINPSAQKPKVIADNPIKHEANKAISTETLINPTAPYKPQVIAPQKRPLAGVKKGIERHTSAPIVPFKEGEAPSPQATPQASPPVTASVPSVTEAPLPLTASAEQAQPLVNFSVSGETKFIIKRGGSLSGYPPPPTGGRPVI